MLHCQQLTKAPERKPLAAKPIPTTSGASSSAAAAGPDPWVGAVEAQKSGAVLEGKIVAVNRGGVVVRTGQLKGFMPFSKMDPSRLRAGHKGELDYLKGQSVRAKIMQLDLQGPRPEMVLSEQAVLKAEALASVKEGQVHTGMRQQPQPP